MVAVKQVAIVRANARSRGERSPATVARCPVTTAKRTAVTMANPIETRPDTTLASFCHQARSSASVASWGTLTLATVAKKQMPKRMAAAARDAGRRPRV